MGQIEKDTIVWVETVYDACMIFATILVVKDKNDDMIGLALYNQFDQGSKLNSVQKAFPKGQKIGVK